jgi:hypothetical protein
MHDMSDFTSLKRGRIVLEHTRCHLHPTTGIRDAAAARMNVAVYV